MDNPIAVQTKNLTLSMCAQPLGQTIYGFLFDAFEAAPYFIVIGAAVS